MECGSDADIAAHTLFLPLPEAFERLLLTPDVVELQQIDACCFQSGQRSLEFLRVGRLEFGGDEKFVAQAAGCGDVAQHAFRIAIGGRRVDEPSAILDQGLYNCIGLAPCRLIILIENIGGAETNGGNALAAAGNRTGEKRRLGLGNGFGG